VDPFAPDSSFVVWVATNALTRKVQEIKANPSVVLLWFDAGDPGYVSLSGQATLVSDSASKSQHWKEEWRGMYRDRNKGDDYLLIRIVPKHLEIVSHTEKMVSDTRTWKPVSIDF
jgi:general stress protein 26